MTEERVAEVATGLDLQLPVGPLVQQPWWMHTGNCPSCGAPFFAYMTMNHYPPRIAKGCECPTKKRGRRRKPVAADGLPIVAPDIESAPMFPHENP